MEGPLSMTSKGVGGIGSAAGGERVDSTAFLKEGGRELSRH